MYNLYRSTVPEIDYNKIERGLRIICTSELEARNVLCNLKEFNFTWDGGDAVDPDNSYFDPCHDGIMYTITSDYNTIAFSYYNYGMELSCSNRSPIIFYRDIMINKYTNLSDTEYIALEKIIDDCIKAGDHRYVVCHDPLLKPIVVECMLSSSGCYDPYGVLYDTDKHAYAMHFNTTIEEVEFVGIDTISNDSMSDVYVIDRMILLAYANNIHEAEPVVTKDIDDHTEDINTEDALTAIFSNLDATLKSISRL